MIYLDILLILNLCLGYKVFKNVIAPPIIVGVGMLGASLVATLYTFDWGLDRIKDETVLVLGFSPILFTLFCMIFKAKYNIQFNRIKAPSIEYVYDLKKLTKYYLWLDIFVAILLAARFYYMRSVFGNLSLPELLFAKRIDVMGGDNLLQYPKFITYGSTISLLFSFYTFYILSSLIITKTFRKYSRLYFYLWGHIILLVLTGFSNGNKAGMVEPIFQFLLMFLVAYFTYRRKFAINYKIYVRIFLVFLVFILTFKGLGSLIGRNTDNYSNNTDMVAEYMGAEIKNFDIFMNDKDGSKKNKYFGEKTFWGLYSDLDKDYSSSGDGVGYQFYGDYSLGNVYTQYFYWMFDFGYVGVVVMTIMVASISMFFYNKTISRVVKAKNIDSCMAIYIMMGTPLFMTFFSSKFTEAIIRPSFLKLCVYIYIFVILFNYLFKQKNADKNIGVLS